MATNLPEGTDSIIAGASLEDEAATNAASTTTTSSTPGANTGVRGKLNDQAQALKGQAVDKARSYALQGKDMATSKLDELVKLVDDAAGTIDEKVGEQYGAYARRAAESISGLSGMLRDKDVDELFEDAKSAVRKSPAVAIGAAAALGFVVARILKAAAEPPAADDKPSA